MAKKQSKDTPEEAKKKAAQRPVEEPDEDDDDDGEDEDEDEDEDDEDDEDEPVDDEEEDDEDLDDEDDEDEDEDDEDEPVDEPAAVARGKRAYARVGLPPGKHGAAPARDARVRGTSKAPQPPKPYDPDNDPTWWAPWAVLIGLVFTGLLGFIGVFTPAKYVEEPKPEPKTTTPALAVSAPSIPPDRMAAIRARMEAERARRAQGGGEQVSASHILIRFKGAQRSDSERTKEAAKQLAETVAKQAKAPGANFAELAKKHSEDPSAPRGGELGTFTRGRMVKPFSDAAFALKPGEVSGVVESPFGFHIIHRTK